MSKGKLLIFSAPSGSGKTTLVSYLMQYADNLSFSISATSRNSRGGEVNGKEYYFLTADEFRKKISNNEFVEWEEVYNGNYYGTLKSEIDRIWSLGKHVIFDVDVKGGLNLKKYFKSKALAVFVRVKDLNVLEERLKHRNTETEENINERLEKAEFELSFENGFDKTVFSDKLKLTLDTSEKLVEEFVFSKNN
ncbi:MAG: guanylate kinase [Cyclobacteriaceae bacterium]|nr:guanylate kinase [Cyclobacteriaceae bacterium]